MFSMRQQNSSPRIQSAGTTPASPSVAELVELNKLGILTKEEIREIILRNTPSQSLPKKENCAENHAEPRQSQRTLDVNSGSVLGTELGI